MLAQLVNLAFLAAQGALLAHVVLSWLRAGARGLSWTYHPVVVWIDDAGATILRPFRLVCDRAGLSRLTSPLDLSPVLAFIVLGWLHQLALALLTAA